jgi:hypothetical protein
MLPKNPSKPRKAVKFVDTKVLIGTLSTAVTIGLWNLFSSSAFEADKLQANSVPPSQDASNEETQVLAPLPTLIPLIQVSAPQSNPGVTGKEEQIAQPTNLRSVAVPTQVVVQKVKPVVDSAVVVSGGGGNRGGNKPIAKTRSSR